MMSSISRFDHDTIVEPMKARIAELEQQLAEMKEKLEECTRVRNAHCIQAEINRIAIFEPMQQLADLRIHASHYKAAEDKDKPIIAQVMVSELLEDDVVYNISPPNVVDGNDPAWELYLKEKDERSSS